MAAFQAASGPIPFSAPGAPQLQPGPPVASLQASWPQQQPGQVQGLAAAQPQYTVALTDHRGPPSEAPPQPVPGSLHHNLAGGPPPFHTHAPHYGAQYGQTLHTSQPPVGHGLPPSHGTPQPSRPAAPAGTAPASSIASLPPHHSTSSPPAPAAAAAAGATAPAGGEAPAPGPAEELQELRNLVDTLRQQLTHERKRGEGLTNELRAMVAANKSFQEELRTLRVHHTSSTNELTAKRAELQRVQRLLDEANARAAAGSSTPSPRVPPGSSGSSRAALAALDAAGPGGLAPADAERWALRLSKAEKALEMERRVSEDLRQQMADLRRSAEQGRAALERLQQLEASLDGEEQPAPGSTAGAGTGARTTSGAPSGSGTPQAGAKPSTLAATSSDPLPAAGQQRPSLGSDPRVARPGGVASRSASVSGGGAGGFHRKLEDQVARLREECDALRAELARFVAVEESSQISVRAAADRARAAEHVALDVQRQCEAAARTIGLLIDENCELIEKINGQANLIGELRKEVARRDSGIRALEALLAGHAAAGDEEAQRVAAAAGGPHANLQQQQQAGTQDASAAALAGGPGGASHSAAASAGHGHGLSAPHGAAAGGYAPRSHQPHGGSEGARPGAAAADLEAGGGQGGLHVGGGPMQGGLSEAEWKLVMLSEEVRRMVGEVSLANAARHALQRQLQQRGSDTPSLSHVLAHAERQQGQGHAASDGDTGTAYEPPAARSGDRSSRDVSAILSQLDELAGPTGQPRHGLDGSVVKARIRILAQHMEALEQQLQEEQDGIAQLQAALQHPQQPPHGAPHAHALPRQEHERAAVDPLAPTAASPPQLSQTDLSDMTGTPPEGRAEVHSAHTPERRLVQLTTPFSSPPLQLADGFGHGHGILSLAAAAAAASPHRRVHEAANGALAPGAGAAGGDAEGAAAQDGAGTPTQTLSQQQQQRAVVSPFLALRASFDRSTQLGHLPDALPHGADPHGQGDIVTLPPTSFPPTANALIAHGPHAPNSPNARPASGVQVVALLQPEQDDLDMDIEELVMEAGSYGRRVPGGKRRVGLWGWITGADVVLH